MFPRDLANVLSEGDIAAALVYRDPSRYQGLTGADVMAIYEYFEFNQDLAVNLWRRWDRASHAGLTVEEEDLLNEHIDSIEGDLREAAADV